jgi:hypothetical protein
MLTIGPESGSAVGRDGELHAVVLIAMTASAEASIHPRRRLAARSATELSL